MSTPYVPDHIRATSLRRTLTAYVGQYRQTLTGGGRAAARILGMTNYDEERQRRSVRATLTSAGHGELRDLLDDEAATTEALRFSTHDRAATRAALDRFTTARRAVLRYLQDHPMCTECRAVLPPPNPERCRPGWIERARYAPTTCPASPTGHTAH